jgi:tripartite-type tricarboxylate transporter receptor subunit TctC
LRNNRENRKATNSSRASAAAGLILLLAGAICAAAASFPERPIRFILGFGTGGPTDIIARTLAEQMSKTLGQNVIVENKVGASGNLATEAVANADADGYTYLLGANPVAVNQSLFPDLPVKFGRDFVAVMALGATANVLVVRPSLNVHTVAEFVQRARAKPDGLTYATVGIGSSSHLAGVEFDIHAGSKMLPVAYHGGDDALKDLLGGRVDAWFATIPSVLGAIQDGQLVALATTGPERAPALPDLPTMAESGFPGYDIRLWVGVFARSGVPAEPLRVVEQAIAVAMASDQTRTVLQHQGIQPLSMDREKFTAFVVQEIARAQTAIAAFKK